MKKIYLLTLALFLSLSTFGYGWEPGYGENEDRNYPQQQNQTPYYPDYQRGPYDNPYWDYRVPSDKENWGHFGPGERERYNPYTHKFERSDDWRQNP